VSEAVEPTTGAGALLHEERRRQNLSLGDVSRQLKLSVRQVEALEREDYDLFGGQVFVHGFVRNYAKLLGLDPEPLLREADRKYIPTAAARPVHEVVPVRARSSSRRGMLGVIAGLLVLGIVLGLLGLNERKGHVAAPPPEQSEDADSAKQPESAPAETTPPTEQPSAAVGGMTAPQEQEPVTLGVVRMVFEEESWVEIRDRSGNTVFAQLSPAGSRRRASGEPPLSVVVGNAAGVQLSYNDRQIDLVPHTRVDVARLTLE
jgi:cytoskeleton protein RodZ